MPSHFSHVQIFVTLMVRNPSGSSVHGILQARILEWVAMTSSKGSSWPKDWTRISYISCIGRQVLYHQHCLGSPYCQLESESESHSVVSDSLRPHGLYSPGKFPGQNTRVGRLSLLQGIFPPQGSNPGLPHSRQTLYQLTHKGSPRILEWVAYPFSSRSSRPWNRTEVSCIAGGFFTSWATREALLSVYKPWVFNPREIKG